MPVGKVGIAKSVQPLARAQLTLPSPPTSTGRTWERSGRAPALLLPWLLALCVEERGRAEMDPTDLPDQMSLTAALYLLTVPTGLPGEGDLARPREGQAVTPPINSDKNHTDPNSALGVRGITMTPILQTRKLRHGWEVVEPGFNQAGWLEHGRPE